MKFILIVIIALLSMLLVMVALFIYRWRRQADQEEDLLRLIIQELEFLKIRSRR